MQMSPKSFNDPFKHATAVVAVVHKAEGGLIRGNFWRESPWLATQCWRQQFSGLKSHEMAPSLAVLGHHLHQTVKSKKKLNFTDTLYVNSGMCWPYSGVLAGGGGHSEAGEGCRPATLSQLSPRIKGCHYAGWEG